MTIAPPVTLASAIATDVGLVRRANEDSALAEWPVFLVAESLKRIGANHFALIGALGPVTTVLADFALLEGALTPLQVAGGALVIGGVLLVTLKKG